VTALILPLLLLLLLLLHLHQLLLRKRTLHPATL
jgi:hypothetical protein